MIPILTALGFCVLWLILNLRAALAGLTTLQANLTVQMGWTATLQLGGGASAIAPLSSSNSIKKTLTAGTTAANAAVGGANEMYSAMTALTASASVSIDFTSVSDIMGQTAGSFARLKGIMAQLLSATDDSVNGTAAAAVNIDNTVVNALSAQSNSGWFNNGAEGGASGSKFCIPNGGVLAFGTPSAGGVVIDSTHKLCKLTNLDSGITANVLLSAFGGST